jgi:hypothetical protein
MRKSFRDSYRDFASTAFPHLGTRDTCVQSGILCFGCHGACHSNFQVKPNAVTILDLTERPKRAFSAAEFKQHKRECEGIQWLRGLDRRGGEEAARYWSNVETFDMMGKRRGAAVIRLPIPRDWICGIVTIDQL